MKIMIGGFGKWFWRKGMLGCFVMFGILGVLVCGYGYAALSTDLLITGEATVEWDTDIEITRVWVNWSTNGANEGYNLKYTKRTVDLYPQIPLSGGEIVYWIETCNKSSTQAYELTRMAEQVKTMHGIQLIYADFSVGDLANVGTVIEPGECFTGRVDAYRDENNPGSTDIASLQLDFKWDPYVRVPFSIDYMQDMTASECAKVSVREEKQLIDKRDGKKYWVAKLQDGNCWMVQNLAYDLSASVTLTPADSDVTTNWTPGSDTNYFKYSLSNVVNDNTRWLSWNLGDNLMLGKPRAANAAICRRYGQNGSAVFAEKISDVCAYAAVLDVTGWNPTWKMQLATIQWPNTDYFGSNDYGWAAANPATREYDAHYKIGNYYQWLTATAGSGVGLASDGANAPNSICPKGWQLPTAPTQNLTMSKSFANLFRMYGIVNDLGQISQTGAENNGYGIYWKPFYGTPSGYIVPYRGYLEQLMEWGGLWSSTVAKKYNAYNLAFMPTMILRSQGGPNEFQIGMPMRCVAR